MQLSELQTSGRYLIIAAALVIILAGIRLGSDILSPLLFSYFLAILLNPGINALSRLHIPRILGILVVVSLLIFAILTIVATIGSALQEFARALPGYKQQTIDLVHQISDKLAQRNINLDLKSMTEPLDTSSLFGFLTSMLTHMGSATSYVFLIFLTVIFMLAEAPLLRNKLIRSMSNPDQQLKDLERFVSSVNRYVALKTAISLLTGLLVALLLWSRGVNFYLLGGILAFALNFIPNIGSILAAIPGILITLLQLGFSEAIFVSAGYFAINMVIGNILEPRVLGKGLGLSPMVVFLSLLIWGWLLGPIGMLLSVPLTISIKILLESSPGSRRFAALLGSGRSKSEVEAEQAK
ncbi:AI-2E family transporter [Endozoicomonas arenosclerae]|uniref:AI-2E family transporter n=1 Tax=Endozoicomonas arenosclerae TaxID=1633495 RepID=UPI000782D9B7|nr:AI-2E family transporter [Endozoicomonas arenosclerae]